MIANLMTSPEDLHEVRAAFVKWDTRKDGVLTEDELSEHMADICQYFKLEEPDARKMLDAADINKDGKIDYAEFITAALDKKKLLADENLKKAFDTLDKHNFGYIKKWNISGILGRDPEAMQKAKDFWNALVASADSDSDGRINFEEFRSHMKQVMVKRASLYAA